MKRRMIRLMNCYRLRKIIRSSSNPMAQAMRLGGHPFQQGTSPHHNPSVYRQPLLIAQNLQSQYLQQFERLLPHIANTTRIKCPPDQRMNDDLGRNYIMRGRHVIQFITYWNKAQRYFVRIRWRRIISVSKNHVQHVV